MDTMNPALILADDNSRFGLKRARIESLKESIKDRGGVMQPIEVEALDTPVDGKEYRLTAGFYRLAAVLELNEKEKAGLEIPVIVQPVADASERLRRQLAENMERENQSPMDMAVAMQKLMDTGATKMDVRNVFGKTKGKKKEPASNSFVEKVIRLNSLPASMKTKIHNGDIGTATAFELVFCQPEKREAILARAEEAKKADDEREVKEEEKFLSRNKRLIEQEAKAQKLADELQAAKNAVEAADKDAADKATAAVEAYRNTKIKVKDNKEKEASAKAHKEAEAAAVDAEKVAGKAHKVLDKLTGKVQTGAEHSKERAEKLRVAREEAEKASKKKAEVKPADIKKAAKAEGAKTGLVQLGFGEFKKAVDANCLPGSNPKTRSVFLAIKKCYSGETTPNQMYAEVAKIVGEKK
jgi:ParB/RepB/Spo0J family partition protein